VGVGLCAAALGYAGYQFSLGYARERVQGRPASQKNPASPQVPIIGHADVRRMLLAQKAWTEGAFALVLYCARLVDEIASAVDDAARERPTLLLELLTPVAKSWPAEYGLEANKYAIQVAGGAGYTRDLPLERLYRDNRLNHIHEGTLGIHGLDLVGRKLRMQDGRALQLLVGEMQSTIRRSLALGGLAAECRALAAAVQAITAASRRLSTSDDAELSLAHATPFLDAFGTVVVAWRWLEMAGAASRMLGGEAPSASTQAYVEGKLRACRAFFRSDLPRARAQLALLQRPDDSFVRMAEDQF
jgi:butyryl-CoA dehydrogenase